VFINASVGRAGKQACLSKSVANMRLVADCLDEGEFLAKLLAAMTYGGSVLVKATGEEPILMKFHSESPKAASEVPS
jgi:hypothetical protein